MGQMRSFTHYVQAKLGAQWDRHGARGGKAYVL